MERFFNTAGPINPQDHYCLSPLERIRLEELLPLIAQKKYFVLHAPRQTGKTSVLLALMHALNAQGQYRCVYINVELAQSAREDVAGAMRAILGQLASRARIALSDPFVDTHWPDIFATLGPHGALDEVLTQWAAHNPTPLILLIDEIDALVGDTLIAVLRQLRGGYDKRPQHFPQSVILCGVRDVRDYRIHSAAEKAIITGGSAFNIRAESLRLGNFSRAEMEALYAQHTSETGQVFTPEALAQCWDLTQGQPWLVNALGYECCFRMKEGRERSRAITRELVDIAKEALILRRETHLDQLADKLREERVQRVIGPLLAGEETPDNIPVDDLEYLRDLGLVGLSAPLAIANPIYREVIPRQLIYTTEQMTAHETAWYVRADGTLDVNKLLHAFQEFFREHAEHWVERFQYKEAGPQLLLQAFLQRVVNGGGRIEREYGLGRRRTDLLILWPHSGGVQKVVLELKVLYKTLATTVATGLEQTWEYLDRCGAEEGHLIIFDRTAGRAWEEKLFTRIETVRGKMITVWGM
ncbi:MAG: AAA family ATPase [Deltaproteobacteria bacterium]|nr:AAA family ATPase [Deltaproteobacteria bacterium]